MPATKAEEKKPETPVGDVPDPDEDDLDDLDDLLDDFSKPKVDTKPAAPAAPSAAAVPPATSASTSAAAGPSLDDKSLEDLLGDEDFAKQLQAGMADLLGEFEKNPEMQKEFDNMFKSISIGEVDGIDSSPAAATTGAATAGSSTGASASATAGEASFQDTIRRTMERMQASGDQATAAAAESSTEDLLAEMMKQLGQGGSPGLGEGSEEDFSKMLMGMMEQLTNKEILHEPMKELHDKFPEWLEKNKATTSAEDLKRYEEQQVLVREIVGKFDEPSYSDSNAADREYIVNRMQKMQDLGSPPPDLVGDMPSAQDAFGAPDMESCNPQ